MSGYKNGKGIAKEFLPDLKIGPGTLGRRPSTLCTKPSLHLSYKSMSTKPVISATIRSSAKMDEGDKEFRHDSMLQKDKISLTYVHHSMIKTLQAIIGQQKTAKLGLDP